MWLSLRLQCNIHWVLLFVCHWILVTLQQVENNYVTSQFYSQILLIWWPKDTDSRSFYYYLFIVKNVQTQKHWSYYSLRSFITGQSTAFVSVMLSACIHYCDFTVWKPKHPHRKAECMTECARVDLSVYALCAVDFLHHTGHHKPCQETTVGLNQYQNKKTWNSAQPFPQKALLGRLI